jgi:hypothetical protein
MVQGFTFVTLPISLAPYQFPFLFLVGNVIKMRNFEKNTLHEIQDFYLSSTKVTDLSTISVANVIKMRNLRKKNKSLT